jgi:SWI/SNF-related matrix-associated actin-dependent regulator of chromatin subfamily A-like protein 1
VFEPFAHQLEGRDFMAARRIAFLLDEMGLGKTWTMIAAADHVGARTVLVITPAAVRIHIAREIARFSPGRQVQVVETGAVPITGDVVIVSYALARAPKIWSQLAARRWDLLVIDEGQALRSPWTKQTRAILGRGGLHERADRVWVLSGSLLPHHRIEEFWAYARALLGDPRSYTEWRHHFGILRETHWGLQHIANRNVGEFKALVAPYTLRRRAADVIGLPALRIGTITVTAGQLASEDVPVGLRAAIGTGDDRAILAAIEQASRDALARLLRVTGEAKLGPALELLREELNADPEHRIIAFAWHTAVLRGLAEGLASFGAVVLEGATPPRQRQEAIDRFQAGAARVFCAQIVAGGAGIDLTAAGHVVLVEQSWSPSDNAQAIARIVRPTQRRSSVLARFIALAGSIDEAVAAVLARKATAGRQLGLAA